MGLPTRYLDFVPLTLTTGQGRGSKHYNKEIAK